MPATLSAYNDALKEVWTQDRLEKQFYDKNPFLDRLEKTSRYHIGAKASVPLETSRNGGYSAVSSAGSSALNAAGNVGIDKADYTYTFHYQQVKIEHAAIVQTDNKAVAVANVIDTEMRGATSAIRKQLTRQTQMNGDALIAKCTTTSNSATVNLDPDGYGYDAIVRRWLHPGLVVDIGTTAAEDDVAAGVTIQSVKKSATDPEIVVSGSTITTDGDDYVSVANARDGTTSYEMNGLLNIVSQTAPLGGINAGGEWQAASVDSTTTTFSLDWMYDQQEAIQQETGEDFDLVLTSIRLRKEFYKQLQMQTRFDGDRSLGTGNTKGSEFAGMHIEAQVDVPNKHMAFLNTKDFFVLKTPKGAHWQNEISGGEPLDWLQGTTAYGGVLMYPVQLGVKRRNSHAIGTKLT